MNKYRQTFFIILFVLSVAQGTGSELKDGFSHTGQTFKIDSVSEKQADVLFREFKDDKLIPYDNPKDGCYARATKMARMAEKKGITVGKVFTEGKLRVQSPDPRYNKVEWIFHVAPILYVNKNGKNQIMVFDPSLFDRPVTVEEWNSKMLVDGEPRPMIERTYYAQRYQLLNQKKEKQKNSWVEADIARAENDSNYYLSEVRPGDYWGLVQRKPIFKNMKSTKVGK